MATREEERMDMEELQVLADAYKAAHEAAKQAKEVMCAKAAEVFPLRVGDVIEYRGKESIVSRIQVTAEIQSWAGNKVSFRVRAWTRRKRANGWHKTENEHHTVADCNFACELKVVRHDDAFSVAS